MIEQRTPEWFASRLGKITASGVDNLMKRTKYGESQYKTRYRLELAIERLTGKRANETPMNEHMRRGVELEPEARDLFAKISGLDVKECGSYQHPEIKNSGASPDGIVNDGNMDFCLEIKCPAMVNHANNLMETKVPSRYKHQIMWQMACTGLMGCYFVTYNKEYPEGQQLKYLFVERDDKLIKTMEDAVKEFDREVDVLVNILKGVKNG
jgi:putative phage-type endonuclease